MADIVRATYYTPTRGMGRFLRGLRRKFGEIRPQNAFGVAGLYKPR
jgi:hypothetical protein